MNKNAKIVDSIVLKRGQVAVSKKRMLEHLNCLYRIELQFDVVMKEEDSFQRGGKIAKLVNQLTNLRQSFQHFELGVPLKKIS